LTPFGQPKGISYSNPSRIEDWEDGVLNNCKEFRVALFDKHTSLLYGEPPTIQKVITYGMFDLLSEIGGLVKIWGFTFGYLGIWLLQRAFHRQLKDQGLKETVTFNNMGKVTDDVSVLETNLARTNKKIEQLESKNSDIESKLNKTNRVQRASVSIIVSDALKQQDQID